MRLLMSFIALFFAAATPISADEGVSKQPVLLELFTSQSCYSCPPAEALLATLADREDLVVLEWHVDYWDELVYGAAGKWKDPFSSRQWTERQRNYNQKLLGKRSAYTPQIVVNGQLEGNGAKKQLVNKFIKTADKLPATISIDQNQELRAKIKSASTVDVWQVTYLDRQTTKVKRGENKGKTLTSRHIVRDLAKLGAVDKTGTVALQKPATGDGCVVLVTAQGSGDLLGAMDCGV